MKKFRKLGLRLAIPEGAGPFPARQAAEVFDIETGEAIDAAWRSLVVDLSPDGTVLVAVQFYPEKIEHVEKIGKS